MQACKVASLLSEFRKSEQPELIPVGIKLDVDAEAEAVEEGVAELWAKELEANPNNPIRAIDVSRIFVVIRLCVCIVLKKGAVCLLDSECESSQSKRNRKKWTWNDCSCDGDRVSLKREIQPHLLKYELGDGVSGAGSKEEVDEVKRE